MDNKNRLIGDSLLAPPMQHVQNLRLGKDKGRFRGFQDESACFWTTLEPVLGKEKGVRSNMVVPLKRSKDYLRITGMWCRSFSTISLGQNPR